LAKAGYRIHQQMINENHWIMARFHERN
jgi:hypothetical protein